MVWICRLPRSPMNWQPGGRNRRGRQRKRWSNKLKFGGKIIDWVWQTRRTEVNGERITYGFWLRKILKKKKFNQFLNNYNLENSIKFYRFCNELYYQVFFSKINKINYENDNFRNLQAYIFNTAIFWKISFPCAMLMLFLLIWLFF